MIEQTVQELTPIVGTRPACRALGASPATIYRRRRPPEPRPARPRPARRGRCRSPSGRPCSTCCTRSGSSTARRRRSGRRCSTRAATSPRSARCTGCSRAHGEVRERRDQLTHPRLRQAGAARRAPQRAVELGHLEAEGAGEVDVLLPVRDPRRVQPLRGRLDGPAPRERRARQGR